MASSLGQWSATTGPWTVRYWAVHLYWQNTLEYIVFVTLKAIVAFWHFTEKRFVYMSFNTYSIEIMFTESSTIIQDCYNNSANTADHQLITTT